MPDVPARTRTGSGGMSTPGNYSSPDQWTGEQGHQYPDPQLGQQPQQYGYGQMPGVPATAQYARPSGPIGQVRSTGLQILLFFVTLGIWSLVYYYQTHEEMKRHTGEGIGGVLALVLGFFVGFVSPFLLSHEVGGLYERTGRPKRVSAATGLWVYPGFLLLLIGPFVWFVKTNGALNEYWRSVGAH
jgi:hypothetical protein